MERFTVLPPGGRCLIVSRRQLIASAAGAALALGLPASTRAARWDSDKTPKPIPGGVTPFGVPVHHYPPVPGAPLSKINDPSSIFDFDGFVGFTRIIGQGVGTDTTTGATTVLNFQADQGFMKGKYIAEDGRLRHGTFGFF